MPRESQSAGRYLSIPLTQLHPLTLNPQRTAHNKPLQAQAQHTCASHKTHARTQTNTRQERPWCRLEHTNGTTQLLPIQLIKTNNMQNISKKWSNKLEDALLLSTASPWPHPLGSNLLSSVNQASGRNTGAAVGPHGYSLGSTSEQSSWAGRRKKNPTIS